MTRVVICLVALVALSGCGDSDPSFTRENVQAKMTDGIRQGLPADTTMDPLECVMDGDDLHWRCLADGLQGEEHFRLIVQITCDAQTDSCISETSSLIQLP